MNNNVYLSPSATASLPPVSKAQIDSLQVSLDYSGWLNTNEKLAGFAFAMSPGTVPPLIASKGTISSNANASPSASAVPGSAQASQPNIANSLLTFLLTQGQPSVQYLVGVTVTTDQGRIKTDPMRVVVNQSPGFGDDCDSDFRRLPGGFAANSQQSVAPAQQQATLFNGASTLFASSFIQYSVSPTAPLGANVLDMWFNTVDSCLYQYVSDGTSAFWLNTTPIPLRGVAFTVATTALGPAVAAGQLGDLWWDTTTVQLKMLINQGGANLWFVIKP